MNEVIVIDEINAKVEEVKAIAEQAKTAAQQAANNVSSLKNIGVLKKIGTATVRASKTYTSSSTLYENITLLDVSDFVVQKFGNSTTVPALSFSLSGSPGVLPSSRVTTQLFIKVYDELNNNTGTTNYEFSLDYPAYTGTPQSTETSFYLPDTVKISRIEVRVTLTKFGGGAPATTLTVGLNGGTAAFWVC